MLHALTPMQIGCFNTVTSCAQAEEDSVYEQFETDCVRQHPRHQLCILMTVGEELS